MGRIYSQASTATIFLSDSWDGIEDLFELVKTAAMDPALHYDPLVKPNFASLGVDAMSQHMHASLLTFLYLPWWTRLWIVQDYALAQHKIFQCGLQTLDCSLWAAFIDGFIDHIDCCNLES